MSPANILSSRSLESISCRNAAFSCSKWTLLILSFSSFISCSCCLYSSFEALRSLFSSLSLSACSSAETTTLFISIIDFAACSIDSCSLSFSSFSESTCPTKYNEASSFVLISVFSLSSIWHFDKSWSFCLVKSSTSSSSMSVQRPLNVEASLERSSLRRDIRLYTASSTGFSSRDSIESCKSSVIHID